MFVVEAGVAVKAGMGADEDAGAVNDAGGSRRDGRRGERVGDPPGEADGVELALDADRRVACAEAAGVAGAAGTRRSESEDSPEPAPRATLGRAGPPWLTGLWTDASSSVSESAIHCCDF